MWKKRQKKSTGIYTTQYNTMNLTTKATWTVAFYDTQSGNEVGLFHIPKPTWDHTCCDSVLSVAQP